MSERSGKLQEREKTSGFLGTDIHTDFLQILFEQRTVHGGNLCHFYLTK